MKSLEDLDLNPNAQPHPALFVKVDDDCKITMQVRAVIGRPSNTKATDRTSAFGCGNPSTGRPSIRVELVDGDRASAGLFVGLISHEDTEWDLMKAAADAIEESPISWFLNYRRDVAASLDAYFRAAQSGRVYIDTTRPRQAIRCTAEEFAARIEEANTRFAHAH